MWRPKGLDGPTGRDTTTPPNDPGHKSEILRSAQDDEVEKWPSPAEPGPAFRQETPKGRSRYCESFSRGGGRLYCETARLRLVKYSHSILRPQHPQQALIQIEIETN